MRGALTAYQVFYPAAAAYGAFVLPASVLAMSGRADALRALADPLGHAHEMLLGFALAVVAGNQLGAAGGARVRVMLLVWAAARAAFLFAPGSLLVSALNAAFAASLAAQVVPRLIASAKKLRNQALPAVLVALGVAALAWEVARYAGEDAAQRVFALATVVLFALLMLFMGGRIIAPAVAGQLHRQGERLEARVQPFLEGGLLIAGAVGLVALLAPAGRLVAAAALATTGVLAGLRLARWRLWAVRGRSDLFCLAAGYGWLSAGLVVFGASLAAGRYESAAVHLITVGALGTLTFNVMAQSWLLKARRAAVGATTIVLGTVLLGAATLFRVLASFHPGPWLLLAAGSWTAAFVVLLALFWRTTRRL